MNVLEYFISRKFITFFRRRQEIYIGRKLLFVILTAMLISGCSSEKDEIEAVSEKTYYEETRLVQKGNL